MLEEFDPEDEAPPVELVTTTRAGLVKAKHERLRALEDELLTDSTDVIVGAMAFNKVEPGATAPPPEWVAELGEERALERFRSAQYGLMPSKDAPVGLSIAQKVHASIVKARATEKAGPRTLNVALIQMPVTQPVNLADGIEVEERK